MDNQSFTKGCQYPAKNCSRLAYRLLLHRPEGMKCIAEVPIARGSWIVVVVFTRKLTREHSVSCYSCM